MAVGQEIRQFISRQFAKMGPVLNEKTKRLWAGATALELGYGGVAAVSQLTGFVRPLPQKTLSSYLQVAQTRDEAYSRPPSRNSGALALGDEHSHTRLPIRHCRAIS